MLLRFSFRVAGAPPAGRSAAQRPRPLALGARAAWGRGPGIGSRRHPTAAASSVVGGASTDLYAVLQVDKKATKQELRSAYRRLALEYHPDVNDNPDAESVFKELSAAYEVLYDDEQRRNYDLYGVDMSAVVSTGAARAAWEGFVGGIDRGAKKSTKFSRARAAAEDAMQSHGVTGATPAEEGVKDGGAEGGGAAEPECGQLVEYPLAEHVRSRNARAGDLRTRGVGLLVNRNKDRGDAGQLPEDRLDLCEVEPLWEEEPGSNEWAIDPLESIHLPRLGEMRVLRAEFDRRYDTWQLVDPPSDDGGSPPP